MKKLERKEKSVTVMTNRIEIINKGINIKYLLSIQIFQILSSNESYTEFFSIGAILYGSGRLYQRGT